MRETRQGANSHVLIEQQRITNYRFEFCICNFQFFNDFLAFHTEKCISFEKNKNSEKF